MSIDFKTYLTPSIPKEIFQILSTYLEDIIDEDVVYEENQ